MFAWNAERPRISSRPAAFTRRAAVRAHAEPKSVVPRSKGTGVFTIKRVCQEIGALQNLAWLEALDAFPVVVALFSRCRGLGRSATVPLGAKATLSGDPDEFL